MQCPCVFVGVVYVCGRARSPCKHVAQMRLNHADAHTYIQRLHLQNGLHIGGKSSSHRKTCCFHSQVQPQSSLHIVMHSLLA